MYLENAQLVELMAIIAWENYCARSDHAFGIEAQAFQKAHSVRSRNGGSSSLTMPRESHRSGYANDNS